MGQPQPVRLPAADADAGRFAVVGHGGGEPDRVGGIDGVGDAAGDFGGLLAEGDQSRGTATGELVAERVRWVVAASSTSAGGSGRAGIPAVGCASSSCSRE